MSATIRRITTALLVWYCAAATQAANFDHAGWDALLKKHVVARRGGQVTQVDYAGFKADRGSLKQYLSSVRQEAYVAERLDTQLEDATRKFLADRSRNRLVGDTLKASTIFKWYREDFEAGWRGANSLGHFLSLYSDPLGLNVETAHRLAAGKTAIDFLGYDWRLNSMTQSRQGGKP